VAVLAVVDVLEAEQGEREQVVGVDLGEPLLNPLDADPVEPFEVAELELLRLQTWPQEPVGSELGDEGCLGCPGGQRGVPRDVLTGTWSSMPSR
jgi:hypothetical protein